MRDLHGKKEVNHGGIITITDESIKFNVPVHDANGDKQFGEAFGAEYVKKAFTPEAKRRMNELIDNLFAAYREQIPQSDWMSSATKEKPLFRFNAKKQNIGNFEVFKC